LASSRKRWPIYHTLVPVEKVREFPGHYTNQAHCKSGTISPEYHHSEIESTLGTWCGVRAEGRRRAGEYAATDSFDVDIQALQRGNPPIVILACCHELPPKLRHDRLLCES
jgi:hypothetical protein